MTAINTVQRSLNDYTTPILPLFSITTTIEAVALGLNAQGSSIQRIIELLRNLGMNDTNRYQILKRLGPWRQKAADLWRRLQQLLFELVQHAQIDVTFGYGSSKFLTILDKPSKTLIYLTEVKAESKAAIKAAIGPLAQRLINLQTITVDGGEAIPGVFTEQIYDLIVQRCKTHAMKDLIKLKGDAEKQMLEAKKMDQKLIRLTKDDQATVKKWEAAFKMQDEILIQLRDIYVEFQKTLGNLPRGKGGLSSTIQKKLQTLQRNIDDAQDKLQKVLDHLDDARLDLKGKITKGIYWHDLYCTRFAKFMQMAKTLKTFKACLYTSNEQQYQTTKISLQTACTNAKDEFSKIICKRLATDELFSVHSHPALKSIFEHDASTNALEGFHAQFKAFLRNYRSMVGTLEFYSHLGLFLWNYNVKKPVDNCHGGLSHIERMGIKINCESPIQAIFQAKLVMTISVQ